MLFRLECRKLRRPVWLTIAFLSILCCILTFVVPRSYSLFFPMECWEVATPWLGLLFPLFVTVPVCWQLYYERRDRFLVYTLPRVSPRQYLTAKYLACAWSAFLILLIPCLLSGLCAAYLVKPDLHTPYAGYTHVLLTLFTRFPAVYALLLSLWKGLLGVLVMTLGFVLALYVQNIFVVLTLPFVCTILEHFCWNPQRQYISLLIAFEPSKLPGIQLESGMLVTGPAVFLALIALVWLYAAKLRHREVYPL